ncbi:MAG: LegC family aminotransferase [Rhodospirillales bacterium]|nr:LegC family aminotransferase [Rhodospirillales bacterium]
MPAEPDAFDPGRVVEALASVVPEPAALHEPEIAGREWEYVKECLDTGWVSTAGAYVERFEAMLADVTGVAHAVATVNGTAALHGALAVAGVAAGDEVIVPALTFVATANAVAYLGARPHFADSEERTLGLDAARLADHLERITDSRDGRCVNTRTGRPITAVVCMHAFGHPVDLDALEAVCRRFGLVLIEDAAESLGTYYKGRHTGAWGQLSILSFNGNKTVTTGGGGAILTNDADLAHTARHLTTTAKVPHAWDFVHDRIGFNYRMPNVNAAIGCAQLERLDDFVERKRRLAQAYAAALDGIAGVRFFAEPEFARSNYWLNLFLLDPGMAHCRDDLLTLCHERGLLARPAWTPMHQLAVYADEERMDLGVAEDIYRRLINLPSSPRLAPSGKVE